MSRVVPTHTPRKEVRHFRRSNRKKVFVDSVLDFFFMLIGITVITSVLLVVLGFWKIF
ncbi:hypothetical protein ANABIO32_24620 [Rossellomorea marisflavi]|uniref:hypothetical protein n=1 Tax=Rossellomorea marisflavi TaxID=189381 RepID=UPI0025CA6644|nr:hypothetical protein [Rossellomorea marisflavi]GLI84749.1 hypothetical protein ANABIO32_24620 [Rossellomorea marisflavi]